MSVYLYTKMMVTGNAEILRDFVKYFENDYDGNGAWYATHDVEGITKEFLNDNCYCIEGEENHFIFDDHILSRDFPGLKFENITECSDGDDVSGFSICINGKLVDYAEGNSKAFGPHAGDEEKCRLCNASSELVDIWDNELCGDCNDFWNLRLYWLVNSGQITEDEYFEFLEKRDFLFK